MQEIEMICQIIWNRQLQTHISGKWFRPLSLLTTYPFRNICSSFLIMMNKFWWRKKVLNLARNWVFGLVLVFVIVSLIVCVSFNLSLLWSIACFYMTCARGDLLRSVPSPKWVAKIKLICTAGCCGWFEMIYNHHLQYW